MGEKASVLSIDFRVIEILASPGVRKAIAQINSNFDRLHASILKKNDLILNASYAPSEKAKRSKSRKKCMSAQFSRDWNLINYFAAQMKVK